MEKIVKFDDVAICVLLSLVEQKFKECCFCTKRGCKTCVYEPLKCCENSIRESMHLPKRERK